MDDEEFSNHRTLSVLLKGCEATQKHDQSPVS